jgi:hypothetical protein
MAGTVAACTPLKLAQKETGPVPVELRVDDAAYWIEEWRRAIALPEERYNEVVAQREGDFNNRPDARNSLRLALLLAEGKDAGRDDDRALELLEGIEGMAVNDSTRALAALLKQVVSERRAWKESTSDEREELKAARRRLEELERQLQELTSIEQNIQERTKQ